jgi:hypothetical protein
MSLSGRWIMLKRRFELSWRESQLVTSRVNYNFNTKMFVNALGVVLEQRYPRGVVPHAESEFLSTSRRMRSAVKLVEGTDSPMRRARPGPKRVPPPGS